MILKIKEKIKFGKTLENREYLLTIQNANANIKFEIYFILELQAERNKFLKMMRKRKEKV